MEVDKKVVLVLLAVLKKSIKLPRGASSSLSSSGPPGGGPSLYNSPLRISLSHALSLSLLPSRLLAFSETPHKKFIACYFGFLRRASRLSRVHGSMSPLYVCALNVYLSRSGGKYGV